MATIPVDVQRIIDKEVGPGELATKLTGARPLRIKYGVDLTAPFLHIGHAVNLWAMRRLQELGHKVVFLLGDFTTRIGDPTGRSAQRRTLPPEEIAANAAEFQRQVGLVLLQEPTLFELRRNSEWYDAMTLDKFLSLVSLVTHSRLVQRDMFQKRIQERHEIHMHEMLYPILQGYDSVMIQADLTIVGSDQLFNEMMGRFYQEWAGQAPQTIVTTRITPGLDGVQKQSKSLGNYIALDDSARDKFGKIMSLPDSLIVDYLEVYTDVPSQAVQGIAEGLRAGTTHPMEAKKSLAKALVARYHGDDAGSRELAWFTDTFSARTRPTDLPEVVLNPLDSLMDVLTRCVPDLSRSELRRLATQRAIELDDRVMAPEELSESAVTMGGATLRIGKRRWFRIAKLRE